MGTTPVLHFLCFASGKTILSTFSTEFSYRTEDYWREEIVQHRLLCFDKPSYPDYTLKGNETFAHIVHRHETPVVDQKIDKVSNCSNKNRQERFRFFHPPNESMCCTCSLASVSVTSFYISLKVFEDEDIVVFNKPPSIPVHPCGSYRRNSLTYLVASEHNLRGLHTLHRLDKHTSGLVIFAKNKVGSSRINAVTHGNEKLLFIEPQAVETEKVGFLFVFFPFSPIGRRQPTGSAKRLRAGQ